MKARLKQKLESAKKYCGQYFIVNTNNNRIAIQEYGMLLADSTLDTITVCDKPLTYLQPQIEHHGGIITDTLHWTAVSGTFVATGNEKYVVLGNFRSSANTTTLFINSPLPFMNGNDVYIDDVSLVEMELPAYAGNDTIVWPGDSVFIGRAPDVGLDYACQWYLLPNDSVPIDTVAGLWVTPNTPATYVVRQQLWCSGVKWDTVTIHMNTVGISENRLSQVRITPNPNAGHITITGLPGSGAVKYNMTDATGRIIFSGGQAGNSATRNMELAVPNGVYFLSLESGGERIVKKVVVQR